MKTKEMLMCALMVAVLAVLAQIAIPIGPVPFTMSIMGVFLAGGLLGSRLGAVTMLVYLLLGAFGLPIFSGTKGGFAVIAGPTGGFLWGYVIAAYLVGYFYQGDGKFNSKRLNFSLGAVLGLVVIYTLGVIQLKFVLGLGTLEALAMGVTPFIIPDLIKIFLVAIIIIPLKNALKEANILV
ncbi:MAG: biotin transporter BioY [Bacillota bacterium]